MNKKETLNLWISLGAGIFAVFLIFSYTQEKAQEISEAFGKKTTVVIAKEFINEMATLQENMVELTEVPDKFVQPGQAKQIQDVVGLVALAPINKGEHILNNKIILPGPETGLSLQVSPGKRAFSIPINKTRAVSLLLKPGDRVDLLANVSLNQGTSQKKYIKTILQDVVILATGSNVVRELPRIHEEVGNTLYVKNLRIESDFDTITIEAFPNEAQKIIYILSSNPNNLFFTLRHPSDNQLINLKQTELADVLGGVARKPAKANPRF
ncbi:MAG: Flp pilus assembly protein CpaB [Bdellovibrionales bacterium]|nr:Flp pilus assembly protein CpaB [Bdellovibrionales bacterium]